jgi:hypothetical protein
MQIVGFPTAARTEITDLGAFIRGRLVDDTAKWPQQAVGLIGYMAWPNDVAGRTRWLEIHEQRLAGSAADTLASLKRIQKHWGARRGHHSSAFRRC